MPKPATILVSMRNTATLTEILATNVDCLKNAQHFLGRIEAMSRSASSLDELRKFIADDFATCKGAIAFSLKAGDRRCAAIEARKYADEDGGQ
jgi:hypothetical protein